MKKVIIGTVLLLTTTLSAFSQTKNITVAGRVIEDDTKEPAVQATVQLLSLPDSAFAAGIATTAQGYFTLPKVQAGKYVLKVSYIGFQPTVLPLQLSAQNPNKNVGTLALKTDAVMLAEAVITAGTGSGRYVNVQFQCLPHTGRGHAGRAGEETPRCRN